MSEQSAVVIGAGVAGLATSTLLSREGYDVTVIDRLSQPGGRAGSYTTQDAPGFRWDSGPSWYLMPEAFDHFYRLCGTSTKEQLELVELHPAYRVITEPSADEQKSGGAGNTLDRVLDITPETIIGTFESIEPGAGERLRKYLQKSSLVYEVAIQKFLYNNFTRPQNLMTREMLLHARLLAVLLARSLDSYVKTVAQDSRLRQVLSYPAVFLSTEPKEAPALYSLMSHTDLIQGPKYPRGGFAAVVDSFVRLAKDNGVKFQMDTEVIEIVTYGKKPRVRGVRIAGGDVDGQHSSIFPADVVVSAADVKHTETKLLPQNLQTYPEKYWDKRNPGLSSVLIYAGVKGKLPELAHHTLLFSKDWDPDFEAVFGPQKSWSHSIYVSKTSATDEDVAPEGYENLFVLVPAAAEPSIGHGSAYVEDSSDVNGVAAGWVEDERVRSIAKQAIDLIAHWAGIDDLAQRIVVSKTVGPADFAERYHSWSGGAIGPAHTLAQSAFFRGKNKSAKVENLYYAGATTVPGVGVPLCLISAENIIKRLRADHTPGPLPEN
ncbi:phytoene desaturase family protein [Corynebacterium sp.]|uniref:phytoene desaturase family protein n=1 Tax=Corynebacterium sp. TaxID=1720 RepID=UPI0028AF4583|nr:phytoene desaturase family protein [Corynebacterium sp.]